MKTKILSMIMALGLSACLPNANTAVDIGQPAPNFTAIDTNGVKRSLSDFKGQNVVLEWSNHACPFVRKHYEPGNMQKLQKEVTKNGDIWITIVSSATGKQGALSAEESNNVMKEVGENSTARILDPSGEVGKLYNARTTPHMFVINKDGNIAYMGAIDSDPRFKPSAIKSATNYVMAALNSLNSGEEIKITSTKPYGCGVKY